MPRSHPTKNDLKSNAKQLSIGLLNARVADCIDLALATKQAHWNLKGPQFIAVQLGGTAMGTTQAVIEVSTLKAYPTDIYAIPDHLAALIDRYAQVANAVRDGIDQTDEAGDADSADILTGISRDLDKALWFLEAHVQEKG
jgi:starvation-inducible DNA-binding protein